MLSGGLKKIVEAPVNGRQDLIFRFAIGKNPGSFAGRRKNGKSVTRKVFRLTLEGVFRERLSTGHLHCNDAYNPGQRHQQRFFQQSFHTRLMKIERVGFDSISSFRLCT
jgi:hypothetical protein